MTSIEALELLRLDLVAECETARQHAQHCRAAGEKDMAFGYELCIIGVEKALKALDNLLQAEIKAFNQRHKG